MNQQTPHPDPATLGPAGAHRPPATGEPSTPAYTGFSAGAVATLVGAVLVLVGYPMVWFVLRADEAATITGLGTTSTDDVVFESSRLHWAAGCAALVLLVIAVVRLIGRYTVDWKRPTLIVGAVCLVGAVLSVLMISSDFRAGTGLYLSLAGAVIAVIGALATAFDH